MTDDELHDRLEKLGSADGPDVDPAFANRLETDLRLTGLRDDLATARPWWQPVIMASVVLVMLVAGFAALRDRGQETEVVMTAADETRIVLPDGTELPGADGIDLADGTRIFVGPDGSATVGGVVLPGGTEGLVVDGHVEIIDLEDENPGDENLGDGAEPAGAGPSGPSPSTTVGRSTTSSREATTSTRPGSTESSAPSTSVAPSTPSTTSGRPSSDPSNQSTISEPDGSPSPTTVIEGELEVVLSATAADSSLVRLTWTAASVPELAGWRVVATAGDRTTVVLVIRDVDAREATLEQLEGPVSYRLVAVDSAGGVLGESNLASL